MKVLITGGAGFLGLHLATYFAKKGWKVSLVDIAPYQKNEYPKGITFINADVRDEKKIARALVGIDVVIHAAAALPLWKAEEIHSINEEGTRNMLDQALAKKVEQFIYISSTAVYGIPKKHPIYEKDRLQGVGPYGKSKIAAEGLCEQRRGKGMIITIIRPKTFVGTHRLGVFEILFDWIKDGKKIPVFGSGDNRYQLLDVEDLSHAIYLFTKVGKKADDVFNIGAYTYMTVRKDLEELFVYAKSGSTILPTPATTIKLVLRVFEALHLSPLYQWVYETADKDSFVSIQKLSKTLGWKPKYSNAQALIKAYRWYIQNYTEVKSLTPGVTHMTGWKQGILGVVKRFM